MKTTDEINEMKFQRIGQQKFIFIKDEIQRLNLIINIQYIIFMLNLNKKISIPEQIRYSIFKNIIIYCASITESLINYKLQELLKNGIIKIEEMSKKNKKYFNEKTLYEISNNEKVCGVQIKEVYSNIEDETQFIDLNRSAKRCALFDDELFCLAEELRGMRNKIHLKGLKKVDSCYSKQDIERAFFIVSKVMNRIKTKY